jgi:TFIIF-interacting CTD phosphatase-like protein
MIKSRLNSSQDDNKVINEQAEDSLDIETVDSKDNIQALPQPPFLNPKPIKPYTLVLDLDETLVHYVEEGDNAFIQIRPGCEQFIDEMANYFELVIFTAAMQDVKLLF